MARPYEQLSFRMAQTGDRRERMQTFVDVVWQDLSATDISWVGFYLPRQDREMVLGPSRNKPACSPIGLHGACGRAYLEQRPLLVHDVGDLGEGYVACDPRDRSEIVVPLFEPDGTCWGVLDVDSFSVGAFSQSDIDGLYRLLQAADLTARSPAVSDTITI